MTKNYGNYLTYIPLSLQHMQLKNSHSDQYKKKKLCPEGRIHEALRQTDPSAEPHLQSFYFLTCKFAGVFNMYCSTQYVPVGRYGPVPREVSTR